MPQARQIRGKKLQFKSGFRPGNPGDTLALTGRTINPATGQAGAMIIIQPPVRSR
jgi:hypothetical protein